MTDPIPTPPEAPDPGSCCGSGCSPCIFDYYHAAFADWEAKVRALGLTPSQALDALGLGMAGKPRPFNPLG